MKLHIEFCIFTVEYNFMYLPITKNEKSMSELKIKRQLSLCPSLLLMSITHIQSVLTPNILVFIVLFSTCYTPPTSTLFIYIQIILPKFHI